jgi:DnaJ-class molecular chaperone
MSYEVKEKCYVCDGTGYLEDDSGNEISCPECHGTGEIILTFPDGYEPENFIQSLYLSEAE